MFNSSSWLPRSVMIIWICNCILAMGIAVKQVWIPYMEAWTDTYTKVLSDPFDGTTMPIAYIPDWTKTANQDKMRRFEDISISEYLLVPFYDPIALLDINNPAKSSTILHYTYITPYMGDYKLDYREYAGWHLGVDIRAPLGTPVLAIANGVAIRTVEADSTGDRFIVIRHDGIDINWTKTSIYSWYLHLSEILVKEGTKIRKWDMIGRVGMSGIATTPHLHLQIDTSDAPFHPYWHFTSAESNAAGVSFYDAINIGLNKDKAEKYTINPMTFINSYLGGIDAPSFSSAPKETKSTIVWTKTTASNSFIASEDKEIDLCGKRQYSDISMKSSFGKTLSILMDKKCLFSDRNKTFGIKDIVTKREAVINIMKFYNIAPSSWTSHFLDIPIGDKFQWYALVAYRKNVLDGNYAYPERILSREEFIELLIKIGKPTKNPSQMKIYGDVDPMNPNYQSIQDYGFMIHARWGKFYPKTLLTRWVMAQILSGIPEKK